jgi:hypothetical protein
VERSSILLVVDGVVHIVALRRTVVRENRNE